MKPAYITEDDLRRFITSATAEDVGEGDHSTLASIPAEARKTAKLLVKDEGILAGVELANEIFRYADARLKMQIYLDDGARVEKGDIAFSVFLYFCRRIRNLVSVASQGDAARHPHPGWDSPPARHSHRVGKWSYRIRMVATRIW